MVYEHGNTQLATIFLCFIVNQKKYWRDGFDSCTGLMPVGVFDCVVLVSAHEALLGAKPREVHPQHDQI
jgi:hypothetical protein